MRENVSRSIAFLKELNLINDGKKRYTYELTDNLLKLGKAIRYKNEGNEIKIWRSIINDNIFFKKVLEQIEITQDSNGFIQKGDLKAYIIKLAGKEEKSKTNPNIFDVNAAAIVSLLEYIKEIEITGKLKVKLASKKLDDYEEDLYPPEIKNSLKRFREDYPETEKTAFIIMRFGKTKAHNYIVEAIKRVFDKHGIIAVRADDKEYHTTLLSNVLTYIYGCSMSVAVFERIEADAFNPNISFEVGYMRALNKPICLLKDKTMSTLHTDLLGELYKTFDPQDPKGSIPPELDKWLMDNKLV